MEDERSIAPTAAGAATTTERSERSSAPTVDDRPASSPRVRSADSGGDDSRYVSGEEIARGGMGRVVEATDTQLGRVVAVKEVLATDRETLRRFARETAITARLEHPSIVPVYDSGTTRDGVPYYVMRKVSGRPLDQLVLAAATLRDRLGLLPHVLAAAQAVAHAHRRGVIHRDLKPTNILVGDLGETVVIDWGLAKVVDDADDEPMTDAPLLDAGTSLRTHVGTVIGTPGFMPPEQLLGEPVDARSDVYALGATLYYVLARRPPHAGESSEVMMEAAKRGPPMPLAEIVGGVPKELAAIVDKALALTAATRYTDAAAFAEDVQRFLTGQLVASHRYSLLARFVRVVRKHRLAVVVAGFALAAIAIGAVIAVRRVLLEVDRTSAQASLATRRQHEAEQAHARTQERADQLVLEHAQMLATTNPTAAVAMLKQLRSPPERWAAMWRDARAIAAEARVGGVAFAVPGPTTPTAVELSPDGKSALVTSENGSTLIDLKLRQARQIESRHDRAASFAGNDHVVTYSRVDLSIVGLRDGSRRDLPIRGITLVSATADTLYWKGRDRHIWRLRLAVDLPEQIAGDDPVDWFEVSGDGRWMLTAGDRGAALVNLVTGQRAVVDPATPRAMAWNPTNTAFVIVYADRIGRAAPGETPTWELRPGALYSGGVALAGASLVTDLTGAIHRITKGRIVTISGPKIITAEMHHSKEDRVVTTRGDKLVVIDKLNEVVIPIPARNANNVAASPASGFVVVATAGRVLVWNLDHVFPPARVIDDASAISVLGPSDFIVNDMFENTWIDLRANTRKHLKGIPRYPVPIYQSKSSDRMCAFDSRTHTAFVFRKGEANAVPLVDVARFVFADDGILFVGGRSGTIDQYDLSMTKSAVYSRSGLPVALDANSAWLAVSYADGLVVRYHRSTGRPETTLLADDAVEIAAKLVLFEDGTVFVARRDRIHRWTPGGIIAEYAVLPKRIVSAAGPFDHYMIVETEDFGAYLIDAAAPTTPKSVVRDGTRFSGIARDGIAVVGTNTSVELVDTMTGRSWAIINRAIQTQAASASISPDGSVVAVGFGGKAKIWSLALPTAAADTAAWLDELTNASAELGPTSLSWK